MEKSRPTTRSKAVYENRQAKERESMGLNPHIAPRTGRLYGPVDESTEANPEAAAYLPEVRKMIEKACQEYPNYPALKCVWLYHYEGRSIAEVACILDVSIESAKTKVARAAKFIGRYIRENENKSVSDKPRVFANSTRQQKGECSGN
jgi:DNA-directed RNA polymerase specialized sigma24 family protein